MDLDVEQLYGRFYPLLRAKCARMLGDSGEAEEVAQETFARLWEGRRALKDPAAALAWLYRTSTRIAIDRIRRNKRSALVADLSPAKREPAGVDEIARAQTREVLAKMARDVPAAELEVVLLSRIDGLTQAEVGSVTGRTERTVRRILARFDDRMKTWTERETRKSR